MQLIQAEFTRLYDGLKLKKIVWVSAEWGLKKGHMVRFEDDNKQDPSWQVSKVYKTRIEAINLDKRWGLGLPKSMRTER